MGGIDLGSSINMERRNTGLFDCENKNAGHVSRTTDKKISS